jgi:hypothetical protein
MGLPKAPSSIYSSPYPRQAQARKIHSLCSTEQPWTTRFGKSAPRTGRGAVGSCSRLWVPAWGGICPWSCSTAQSMVSLQVGLRIASPSNSSPGSRRRELHRLPTRRGRRQAQSERKLGGVTSCQTSHLWSIAGNEIGHAIRVRQPAKIL